MLLLLLIILLLSGLPPPRAHWHSGCKVSGSGSEGWNTQNKHVQFTSVSTSSWCSHKESSFYMQSHLTGVKINLPVGASHKMNNLMWRLYGALIVTILQKLHKVFISYCAYCILNKNQGTLRVCTSYTMWLYNWQTIGKLTHFFLLFYVRSILILPINLLMKSNMLFWEF